MNSIAWCFPVRFSDGDVNAAVVATKRESEFTVPCSRLGAFLANLADRQYAGTWKQ